MRRAVWPSSVALALSACVLADPAPTLPVVPEFPPTILTTSVVPLPPVLVTWPSVFEIPVLLSDPSQTIKWLAFVDYVPGVATSPTGAPKSVLPTDGAAIRLVRASFDEPLGLGFGCHTVQVIIAYDFNGNTPVNPPGGSVVTWLYTSSGNPAVCTPYEAGALLDGAFPSDGAPSDAPGDGGS